jgi:hypothetical protein
MQQFQMRLKYLSAAFNSEEIILILGKIVPTYYHNREIYCRVDAKNVDSDVKGNPNVPIQQQAEHVYAS